MSRSARPDSEYEGSLVARFGEAIAFSPLIPCALAAGLTWVGGEVIATNVSAATRLELAVLAGAGSGLVYGLDRLRDLDRDRETSPRRTAFIQRHHRAFALTMGVAALVGGVCLLRAQPAVWLLCAIMGGLGLLHRRLKQIAAIKTLYVSSAWTAVCVGLPWWGSGGAGLLPSEDAFHVAAILFPCFASNLIASNLRDAESSWLRQQPRSLIAIATGIAAMGFGVAMLGSETVRALAWVPAALVIALIGFRPSECYGHVIVDGSLLLGTLAAAIQIAAQ